VGEQAGNDAPGLLASADPISNFILKCVQKLKDPWYLVFKIVTPPQRDGRIRVRRWSDAS
jgi:hypothetical protein